ncbi:MAG: SUMF1/EgtB/PvdO family nonheme iron enzyme, partial [Rhodobacterales bacterium]
LHPDLHSHALLPLPKLERQKALDPLGATDPFTQEWVEPGLWSLGLAEGRALNLREAAALPTSVDWLQEARDAETLGTLPVEAVVSRVKDEPARWSGPLQMLIQQIPDERAASLAKALMAKMSEPLLLAAADLTRHASPHAPDLARALIQTIETGGLAPALRRRGGEALAHLGDRRDLTRLVKIPAGTYQMGGDLHPNSTPVHAAIVPTVCIAAYPVTCAAYVHFTQATGRPWLSANGRDPERTSHPATDLTWHDARAYCAWLTDRWRAEGRIKTADIVRLPTECEWEAAARGPDGLTYPWGNDWAADHANDEETGFNDICTVGLFPEGTSALGCFDMVGQVWEWCTTLWG